jgi:hypothetical protein
MGWAGVEELKANTEQREEIQEREWGRMFGGQQDERETRGRQRRQRRKRIRAR